MIVSFYSYKGGVGRTQLCANLAAYLCFYKHRKILLWDWDFEAPGLHYYFGLTDRDIQIDGTLELLEEHIRLMNGAEEVGVEQLKLADKSNVVALKNSDSGGQIDLLPAGKYGNDYSSRLSELNWYEFITESDGVLYLDEVKKNLVSQSYDYIFIDSRTGINDYAGICNVLLPDCNIVVMSPNEQSYQGSQDIIDRIRQHPYILEHQGKRPILPILSRLDDNHDESSKWIAKLVERFEYILPEFVSEDTDLHAERHPLFRFVDRTYLRYVYSISVGENLLFDKEAEEVYSFNFKQNYANLAEYLEELRLKGAISLGEAAKADDVKTAEISLKTAERAQAEGKNEQAYKFYEEAVGALKELLDRPDIGVSHIWSSIGQAYIGQKRYSEALEAFKQVLRYSRPTAHTLLNIGTCLFEMEQYREADRSLKQAQELADDKTRTTVQYYRGRILLEAGQQQVGIHLLDGLLSDLQIRNNRMQQILQHDIENVGDEDDQ